MEIFHTGAVVKRKKFSAIAFTWRFQLNESDHASSAMGVFFQSGMKLRGSRGHKVIIIVDSLQYGKFQSTMLDTLSLSHWCSKLSTSPPRFGAWLCWACAQEFPQNWLSLHYKIFCLLFGYLEDFVDLFWNFSNFVDLFLGCLVTVWPNSTSVMGQDVAKVLSYRCEL